MDTIDLDIFKVYNDVDILDLILRHDEIWDYLLSTPQFEEYLQELAKALDSNLEEAKEYFEDNSWSELKGFVLENKDIQEYLNKNLTIDFHKLRFRLSKESS